MSIGFILDKAVFLYENNIMNQLFNIEHIPFQSGIQEKTDPTSAAEYTFLVGSFLKSVTVKFLPRQNFLYQ